MAQCPWASCDTVNRGAISCLDQKLSQVIILNYFLVSKIGVSVCEQISLHLRASQDECGDVTTIRKGHGSIPTAHNRHDELAFLFFFFFFKAAWAAILARVETLLMGLHADVQTEYWRGEWCCCLLGSLHVWLSSCNEQRFHPTICCSTVVVTLCWWGRAQISHFICLFQDKSWAVVNSGIIQTY